MRVLVQRVSASKVEVDGRLVGEIGRGLNLLVGISATDTDAELDWMMKKILGLRLFPEGDRSFSQSVMEIAGDLLVISQFTLYGDGRKGRRLSFDKAAPGDRARTLFDGFVERLRQSELKVETGQFGAMMQVSIANDGPVTVLLEREAT